MNRAFPVIIGSFLVAFAFVRPAAAQDAEAAAAEEAAPAAEAPQKTAPPEEALKVAPVRAANTIYAEGLGAGFLYSINYERLVTEDIGVRAGFSYISVGASATSNGQTVAESKATLTTIPITVSYLGVGSKHNMLELGGGASLSFASGSASSVGRSASGSGMAVLPDLMIGYRLHPVDGAGFNFRVGAMAFFGKGLGFSDSRDPDAFGVLPWFYLSLGASF